MSTSEYRSVDAESDLPISAAELAALATQLFAASVRPGPDSPPQAAPVAPRGNVPDTTAAASAGPTAAGAADPFTPQAPAIAADGRLRARADIARAGRHSAGGPGRPAGQRAGYDGGAVGGHTRVESATGPATPSPTSGIVPTVPGVLAGSAPTVPVAPRGSAPGWLPGAPTIVDLGWTDAPAARAERRRGELLLPVRSRSHRPTRRTGASTAGRPRDLRRRTPCAPTSRSCGRPSTASR